MPVDPSRRIALSRQLAGVDVHPSSLPPSAVLLVRRLSDPAPGTLRERDPAMLAPAAWTRALQRAVDRAARGAVRPAAGPVPASATAVVFLDQAELIACLARDFLLGGLAANWWWQAWLQATGRSTLQLVLDAWLREARHIPAAMARLQRQTLAFRFAASLSEQQARTLLVALADAYELPALIASPPAPRPARRRKASPAATGAAGSPLPDERGSRSVRTRTTPPPWQRFGAHVEPAKSLGLEQATFAGIALSLWQAPLVVRTSEFHRALHKWRRAVVSRPLPASGPADADMSRTSGEAASELAAAIPEARTDPSASEGACDRRPMPVVAAEPLIVDHGADESRARPVADSVEDGATRFDTPALDRSVRRTASERAAAASESAQPRPHFVDTPARHPPLDSRGGDLWAPPAADARPLIAPSARQTQAIEAGVGPRVHGDAIVTELGGILFLVNVLEHLRFFDRLDDHFRVKSTIGGWGWLEIVARCLLGSGHADAARDPIWDAIAELDGRERQAPIAASVRVTSSPRLPDAWPAPARLPRGRVRPLAFESPPDLQRLLDLAIPYLRWRLLTALDLPVSRRAPLASRLFYRHGRLEWTATHVDLHMDMSGIDIAVRLAGLDANPGWVPALGRVVTFHFH
jgi:hypothetical protein